MAKTRKNTPKREIGFCDFDCMHADLKRAMHAACLATNGPYCLIKKRAVPKCTPCAEYESSHSKREY